MKRRLALLLLVVALVVAFFAFDLGETFSFDHLKAQQHTLDQRLDSSPLRFTAVVVLVYVFGTALALPIPGVSSLLCGALYGLPLGLLLTSFCSTIGSTLGFLLGRFVIGDALRARFARRFGAIEQGVQREGAFYLFSLRLVPVFPLSMINLGMALTPMRTWTFYWVSQLGMLPASIVWVNAGTQLSRLEDPDEVMTPGMLAAFGLLIVTPVLAKGVLAWLRGRATPN